jgi:hypothetical protein
LLKFNNERVHPTQDGTIVFYVLFVLPIAMALLIIVVDISAWQSLREEAQSEADRIALQVAQHLPYKDEVVVSLRELSAKYNTLAASRGSSLRVRTSGFDDQVSSFQVRVALEGVRTSFLDSFLRFFTGESAVFFVLQESQVRLTPVDAVLIFSDALSMRPGIPTGVPEILQGEATWGDSFDWPSSEYFDFVPLPQLRPSPEPEAPVGWPQWWHSDQFNSNEYKRWATQLCYNPVFSALKFASLMITDTISASPLNRIGVLASPGDQSGGVGFSSIKKLTFQEAIPVWSNYFEPSVGNCDEACVMYAANSSWYRIPPSFTGIQTQTNCDVIIDSSPFGDPLGHYPNPFRTKLSSCFLQGGASLREVLYYHSVRHNRHEVDALNIARALRTGISSLIEEEKITGEEFRSLRGNLAGVSSRLVFLISDALPPASHFEVSDLLSLVEDDPRLKLYVLGYNHQGLTGDERKVLGSYIGQYHTLPDVHAFLVQEDTLAGVVQGIIANERRLVIGS